MLPKSERLKDKKVFNFAFKVKQVLRSNFISLYYLFEKKNPHDNLPLPKAAFAVGTSVFKSAVKRNLLKRRMSNVYRVLRKVVFNKEIDKDKIYIISSLIWVANPSAKNATFVQVKEDMEKLFKKLEIGFPRQIQEKSQFKYKGKN